MDYSHLCEEMCHVHDVIAAVVIDKGQLVAGAGGKGIPEPDSARIAKLLVPLHIIVSIPQTNADIAGALEYVVV